MSLNPRQKRFAELYHRYGNATRAYGEAYDAPQNDDGVYPNWVSADGHRLVRNEKVRAEVERLKGETAALSSMTREEMVDYLVAAIITPVEQIGPRSPLCEEYTIHRKPGGRDEEPIEVVKIKAVSKTGAIKELAALCGFKAPQKVELSADSEVVEMLRGLTGAKEKE